MGRRDKLKKLEEKDHERSSSFEERIEDLKPVKQDVNVSDTDRSQLFMKISIHDKIQDRFQPLSKEQLEDLKNDLLKHGFKDPIEYTKWKDNFILVDGHNRRSVYLDNKDKLPVPPLREVKGFNTLEDIIAYVDSKQVDLRRNLSSAEYEYFMGRKCVELEEEQKGKRKNSEDTKKITAYLAERYGTSESSIKRSKNIYKSIQLLKDNSNTFQAAKHLLIYGFQDLTKKNTAKFKEGLVNTIEIECMTQSDLLSVLENSKGDKKIDVKPIQYTDKLKADLSKALKYSNEELKENPEQAINDMIAKLNAIKKSYKTNKK